MSLKGKRIFITGGSRGIGLAIALRAAADGASIAIAAKTADPNPKLPGTIFTAAAEIEAAGGKALAIQCDIRDENAIVAAVNQTAEAFGGIDIVINNASAINLTNTENTPAKRFDLMMGVNTRGTFLTSQAALPFLRKSAQDGFNPHILMLSPPLSMKGKWFKPHLGVNALWPRTAIDTAALAMIPGVDTQFCRKPEILSDSAYIIFNRPAKECTGNFFIDDELLASEGVTDLEKYSVVPGTKEFIQDLFVD
jgi:citronellol/citronellal dehydrogenase